MTSLVESLFQRFSGLVEENRLLREELERRNTFY
jgi:hypothetical protein